ncbi:MAG: hypothetical protein ACRCYX_14855 [Dermatophilaceae bacterium]
MVVVVGDVSVVGGFPEPKVVVAGSPVGLRRVRGGFADEVESGQSLRLAPHAPAESRCA